MNDAALAQRLGCWYEDVADLDEDVYRVLVEELQKKEHEP